MLHKLKEYLYSPKIPFGGSKKECFKVEAAVVWNALADLEIKLRNK